MNDKITIEKCKKCGTCCSLFYINLNEDEYNSGYFKTVFEEISIVPDFLEANECGANILAKKEDRSCIYLNDNECSIHEKRPEACRAFFCASRVKGFEKMQQMIAESKKTS